MNLSTLARACGVLATSCVGLAAHADDRFYGTTSDMRTVLLFRVPDKTAQKLIPAGWEIVPADEGVNLQLILSENVHVQSADGKVDDNLRSLVLVVPAKKNGSDERVAVVAGGLISRAEKAPGPYSVFVPAVTDTSRKTSASGGGKTLVEEKWRFESEAGDTASLDFEFVRGALRETKLESKIFSAKRSDFFRVYRVEQVSEAIPAAANADRLHKLEFRAAGPTLGSIFDGSEQLVGVVSIPWYSRKIYLPGS